MSKGKPFRIAATIGAVLGVLSFSGCGAGGPVLYPVSGVITLNSKPLEDADVSFIPDPSNKDVTPGGDRTGPEGNYRARSNGRYGLAPGKYKVVVNKSTSSASDANLPDPIKFDRVQQEMSGIRKESLPSKYTDATQTAESFEVKEVKDNVFDMDIKVKK